MESRDNKYLKVNNFINIYINNMELFTDENIDEQTTSKEIKKLFVFDFVSELEYESTEMQFNRPVKKEVVDLNIIEVQNGRIRKTRKLF